MTLVIRKSDLIIEKPAVACHVTQFFDPAGIEHYPLLQFLARQMQHRSIIDLGTYRGASALALAANPTNHVHTFDLDPQYIHHCGWRELPNVTFHAVNLYAEKNPFYHNLLLDSGLILIDTDPHEGIEEWKLVQYLQQHQYQGWIVLDDIHYFENMKTNLWQKIPDQFKWDLTSVGHVSGTGLVCFRPDFQVRLEME